MPFTYFAHQVPVLPLKSRHPDRWDGLALVVGSILPDLHYVTSGWLFGPFGMPLWTDGHRLDLVLQNCVLPGVVLTVLLRRWAFPVIPVLLPGAGPFHLRDLRFVSLARHRWWVTAYSVLVGAVSHIVIDAFTHADGAVVEQVALLREPLFDVAGHGVEPYQLLQYAGHVAGSALGVYLLLRLGRERAMLRWPGVAAATPGLPPIPTGPMPSATEATRARRAATLVVALGALASIAYGIARLGDGAVPAFMAVSCGAIVTVLAAGAVGRRLGIPLPAPIDPGVE